LVFGSTKLDAYNGLTLHTLQVNRGLSNSASMHKQYIGIQ